MRASWLTLALAVGMAAPASAQNDVARRSFTFFGNNLVIEILDRSAGELKVIRGGNGRVDVAARAPGGFAGFGLGGIVRDRLRLGSAGAYRVEYLITIPDDVRLQVQLPNGDLAPAEGGSSATFRWEALPENQTGGNGGLAPQRPELPDGSVLTYVDPQTPQVIGFNDLRAVRSIEVWLTGDDFRVAASTPLAIRPRAKDQILVDLGNAPPIDLVFMVPPGIDRFGIRVNGEIALLAGDGEIETTCSPAVVLTGADGVRRARITPEAGRLRCS